MREIERKFLLDQAPAWLEQHASRQISQGYLAVGDGVEVRLRRADDDRLLTVKRGTGETREEVEVTLDRDQFERLWGLTESRRVAKRRFLVPLDDGHHAEVDVYRDSLAGLVVAEVEFSSEAESHRFRPPAWFGLEVTGDERYANRELALHGRHAPGERRR
jgi:adenylate cyclase